jgi:lipopolysaccharide biosynthesis regulator YciM
VAPLAPAAPPQAPATEGATPFSSSTLAELYYQQGLVERAVDVYRQLVTQDPANEKARLRLVELESADAAPDERATRRRALERTIAGLESLLAAVQRR